VRIPPLFSEFWNTILINDAVRSLLRALAADGREAIESGYKDLGSIERIKKDFTPFSVRRMHLASMLILIACALCL
jgi:hypothetical protein